MPPQRSMPMVSTYITNSVSSVEKNVFHNFINTVTKMQPTIEYESTLNTPPALMLDRRGNKAHLTTVVQDSCSNSYFLTKHQVPKTPESQIQK